MNTGKNIGFLFIGYSFLQVFIICSANVISVDMEIPVIKFQVEDQMEFSTEPHISVCTLFYP